MYMFKKRLFLLVGSALAFVSPNDASALSYLVPASANISAAGLGLPVAPGGGGAGTLPVLQPVQPGQTSFRFSTSGMVSQYFEGYYQSGGGAPYPVDIFSYGGVSGFKADVTLPLVGVFLSSNPPQGPAPMTLQFTSQGLGLDFATLSPGLGQVFLIGDGKTSGNADQTFFVPANATRLFLGYADAPFSTGDPGAFDDNRGALTVEVTAVPEPGLTALLGLAGVAMMFRRKIS